MALRKINIGKEASQRNIPREHRSWKTLNMFKNLEELKLEADKLRKKKYEVEINEKLLKLRYR